VASTVWMMSTGRLMETSPSTRIVEAEPPIVTAPVQPAIGVTAVYDGVGTLVVAEPRAVAFAEYVSSPSPD
jgi:hypothetical protein